MFSTNTSQLLAEQLMIFFRTTMFEEFDEPIRASPIDELQMLIEFIKKDFAPLQGIKQPTKTDDMLFYVYQSMLSFIYSTVSIMKQDEQCHLDHDYFKKLWEENTDMFKRYVNTYIPQHMSDMETQCVSKKLSKINRYIGGIQQAIDNW